MNDAIIERIKRLRALSTSDNVHEAAAAARMAEKLIQEHNLSEAALEDPDRDVDPIRDTLADESVSARWKGTLLVYLSHAYQCAPIRSFSSGKPVFVVYGRPQDVDTLSKGRTARKQSSSVARINPDAYAAGKRAGANMNQRTAIGAGGARLLGC